MNKPIYIMVAILGTATLLSGCAAPKVKDLPNTSTPASTIKITSTTPTLTTPTVTSVAVTSKPPVGDTVERKPPSGEYNYVPPNDVNWITPGKVNIANFHAGATAEYPLTIHNGSDNKYTERKQVTTGTNDPSGAFTLKHKLSYGDVKAVTNLASDLPADKLSIQSYDANTGEITITGFADNAKRIITIEYIGQAVFGIYVRQPTRLSDGYVAAPDDILQDWVMIADPTPIMEPKQTKDITIAITMPSDATKFAPKWEFWVGVSDGSSKMIVTELVSKWLVSMR